MVSTVNRVLPNNCCHYIARIESLNVISLVYDYECVYKMYLPF